MAIESFSGENEFLSNFFHQGIVVDGVTYKTNEHAFQAMKTINPLDRKQICAALTPGAAKTLGRAVQLRKGWEEMKIGVMKSLIVAKFQEPTLRAKLLATGDQELVEGNWWGDKFWGVCDGEGENWLGKLLMEVREEIRNTSEISPVELTN